MEFITSGFRRTIAVDKFVNMMDKYDERLDYEDPYFDDFEHSGQISVGSVLITLWCWNDEMVISFEHFEFPPIYMFRWTLDKESFHDISYNCSCEEEVIEKLMGAILESKKSFGHKYGLR